jgi:LIVCS family branched-chain amino acid:cation transporter
MSLKRNFKIILTAGIAMFAMFFGSGNLVFPLELGVITGENYLAANIGFIISGVIVPFLGLYAVMLYEGDRARYFGLLGDKTALILTFILLSLLGPFAVVPRCILVAFGGVKILYPNLSLPLFSFIFSSIILFIIWEKNNFIPIIGKILGPIKIITIGVIIAAGIIFAPSVLEASTNTKPFSTGLLEGYQTMDLPAAFFFSVTIMAYLKSITSKKDEMLKLGIYSSLVGGSLIAIIYFLFCYLGAHYAPAITDTAPEEYLASITNLALGKSAAFIFAVTMLFACLTTASTLAKLYAEFIKTDICKDKISWHLSSAFVIALSFALSNAGFAWISKFLGGILAYLYPALIAFTAASILNHFRPFPYIKDLFWGILLYEVISKNF